LTHQEVEVWAREIVEAVLANQRIEDSRVELKSLWPEPDKAAHHLAAHANAARGTPVLWLIGVDEKAQRLTGANPVELANWSKSVERFFDGDSPRMALDANVRIERNTVVALYFETHQGAPFAVKNLQGGYPQFIVPWREATSLRAANRAELLRILVPIRRLSGLIDELGFNLTIAQGTKTTSSLGTLFREEEFHRALRDGALSTLTNDERQRVTNAYRGMSRANQRVTSALNSSFHSRSGDLTYALKVVRDCQELIEAAHASLSRVK